MYDYHARQYEPAIGRFTSIDPLAEKYYSWSPYAYVGDNPIKRIDPNGMAEYNPNTEVVNGEIVLVGQGGAFNGKRQNTGLDSMDFLDKAKVD